MGLSMQVERGAESWQFFAFVFAALVTLFFGLIDEVETPSLRILLKVISFVIVGYLTLINVGCRNWLVGLLGQFKKEQHR